LTWVFLTLYIYIYTHSNRVGSVADYNFLTGNRVDSVTDYNFFIR